MIVELLKLKWTNVLLTRDILHDSIYSKAGVGLFLAIALFYTPAQLSEPCQAQLAQVFFRL